MGDNVNVAGSAAVGRDANVGGNVRVQGEMIVRRNMKVKGWFDAPNIKGPNKGVFESVDALNDAYPKPVAGAYAGVLSNTGGIHVQMYYVNGGVWTDAGCTYEGATDYPQKANKPLSYEMNGHLAELDSNGNLVDSAKTVADFATAAQGEKADTALQEHQDISGKAEKSEMSVTDGTGADADKTTIQLKSGMSATVLKEHQDISDKQDKLTFDDEPTSGSNNPVTSGGVYTAISMQKGRIDTLYTKTNELDGAVATAQGAKQAAQTAAGNAATANQAAQTAAGTAETAATAAANALTGAVSAAGRAVGEAVRVTYNFDEAGKFNLCNESADLLLISIDGAGQTDKSLEVAGPGSVTVSFVFAEPTEIPNGVFSGIRNITGLHIPSFVHNIGKNAFLDCNKLEDIDCEAMTPPTLGAGALGNISNEAVLTVHRVVGSSYANWGGIIAVNNY